MVVSFRGLLQVGRRKGPQVANSLDGASWLKNFDGQRHVGNTEALEEVNCKLLDDVCEDSLLLVQHLLVCADQTTILGVLKTIEYFVLLNWLLYVVGLHLVVCHVLGRWAVFVVRLSLVCK